MTDILKSNPLLEPQEPAAFESIDIDPRYPCLLVCDHASRRIPAKLANLGLDDNALATHLAQDIGAGAVTRALSSHLSLPAVLAGYSRLVVDCNRALEDPTVFLRFSDGVTVPGNTAIDVRERKRRVEALYWPYHEAIDAQLQVLERVAAKACLISIHSFSPVFNGKRRSWDAGVLWDKDPRLALPVIAGLRAVGSWKVGDNEPYSGRNEADFTIDHHAEGHDRPHLALEIRQDHLSNAEGIAYWAELLAQLIEPLLMSSDLYRPPSAGDRALVSDRDFPQTVRSKVHADI